MFTGIIKELGRVCQVSGLGGQYHLSIEAKDIIKGVAVGDSVAINGVCLTLTGKSNSTLFFDVIDETMKRTNLSKLRYGDIVNVEDSLRAGGSLSGHFVMGHIDCIGRIKDIKEAANNISMEVVFPEEYSNLVVEKGSIAIDGISLTIGKAGKRSVIVYIIPHTLKMTTLGFRRVGDEVNIEFDIIGKYIANLHK